MKYINYEICVQHIYFNIKVLIMFKNLESWKKVISFKNLIHVPKKKKKQFWTF